ncbi:unnamed protein product [Calypogeia fissa]
MGMGPILPFLSWVWFRFKWMEFKYRNAGLESKLIDLGDGATTMHCWVPKESSSGTEKMKRPAILFLQGFGMNGMVGWELQAPYFAKNFDVYVPDLLFFGKSFTTETGRSELFQGDCVKKMLDILNVNKVHVVGTSYGGITGYYMAHNYPKLVDKLVVASAGVTMDPTSNERLAELAKVSSVKELLVPKDVNMLRRGMDIASIWRTWMIPNFVLQDMFDWFHTQNSVQKKELVDGMITGTEGAPPVPTVPQDVLILWGTKDQIFLPELADQLKRHLGDKANLIYVKGCGHVPQIEKPKEYNSHLLKFLST